MEQGSEERAKGRAGEGKSGRREEGRTGGGTDEGAEVGAERDEGGDGRADEGKSGRKTAVGSKVARERRSNGGTEGWGEVGTEGRRDGGVGVGTRKQASCRSGG